MPETHNENGSPRVILMTGCASGIGRATISRLLARHKRDLLVATDVDEVALREAAERAGWPAARVLLLALDVRDPDAWASAFEATFERFDRLDVVINNAGVLHPAYVHAITPAQIDLHVDVNIKGVMHGTHLAARHMLATGRGHIINIGSLASLAPVPGLSLYGASKFAVRGFSLAAAQELAPHGVHLSLVMPDAVRTPMLDLQRDYDEAAMTFSGAEQPLVADDIAALIVDRVLVERPLEVSIPPTRGALARLATVAPEISMALSPLFIKLGRKRQQQYDKDFVISSTPSHPAKEPL